MEVPSIINPPRPCEVTSHQFYTKGVFHGWEMCDGQMLAVVETLGPVPPAGTVQKFDKYYTVKFLDRGEQ